MSSLYHNAIFVSTKDQMPKVEHWAIFKFSTIHIPGDERSRTNPGHGYPASNEPIVKYEAYLNKADWEEAVKALAGKAFPSEQFVAARVNPAEIRTVHTVVVKEG